MLHRSIRGCLCGDMKRDGTEAVPYGCLLGAYSLFTSALVVTLATPFPSVRTGDFPYEVQRSAAKISDWRIEMHRVLGAPLRGAGGRKAD